MIPQPPEIPDGVEVRRIPDLPQYLATSDGQIIGPRGKPIKTRLGGGGYLRMNAWKDGEHRSFQVNRLVCSAFHGPAPEGPYEAAHWNGDRLDNRASNLRWATKLENAADKQRHGTTARGEKLHATNGRGRLTADDVREIRRRLADGEYGTEIAKDYGVHQAHISKINRREIWAHV